MSKIGIVILATNAYFVLGLRFVRRFVHFYEGNSNITFYFFSDENPINFLEGKANVNFYKCSHKNWVEGVNSKFSSILSAKEQLLNEDYVFYFDADTNVNQKFGDWFLGDMVAGEHYGNRDWMKDIKAFDRNPYSTAYIPFDTTLPQMYYYGAFFGGSSKNVIKFCQLICECQSENKKINYEPPVNDESYINHYFHYNPPTTVIKTEDFKFIVSDKGGIGETRNPHLDISEHKRLLLQNKGRLFDITNNRIIFDV